MLDILREEDGFIPIASEKEFKKPRAILRPKTSEFTLELKVTAENAKPEERKFNLKIRDSGEIKIKPK